MSGLRLPHLGGGRQKVLDQPEIKAPLGKAGRAAIHSTKVALWLVQRGICGICGCEMPHPDDYSGPRPRRCSLEHVIPKARGGAEWFGNVLAACLECNERKADKMPTGCSLVWLLYVNAVVGAEPLRW